MLWPITLGCRLPPPPPRLPGWWDPPRSRSRRRSRGASRGLRVRGRAGPSLGRGRRTGRREPGATGSPTQLRERTRGAPEAPEAAAGAGQRGRPLAATPPAQPCPAPRLPSSSPSGREPLGRGAEAEGSEGAGGLAGPRSSHPGAYTSPPGRDPHLSPDPPPAGPRWIRLPARVPPAGCRWAAAPEPRAVGSEEGGEPSPRGLPSGSGPPLPRSPPLPSGGARTRAHALSPPPCPSGHHGALPVVWRSRGGAVLVGDVPGTGVRLAATPGGAGSGCPSQWGRGWWHVGSDPSGVRVPATELGPGVR